MDSKSNINFMDMINSEDSLEVMPHLCKTEEIDSFDGDSSQVGSPCPSFSSSYEKSTENPLSEEKGGKTKYKHVPHSEKPVQVVQRRNARERRRVQTVNSAFSKLRKHIPYENRHKRLSKVKTLQIAIDYIRELSTMLNDHDSILGGLMAGTDPATAEMLQTALGNVNVNAGHCFETTSSMASQYPDLHAACLPTLPSMADSSVHNMIHPNMQAGLFTGTGGLLDFMASSSMDWLNQS